MTAGWLMSRYGFGLSAPLREFHKHLRRGIEFHPNLSPEVKEPITQHVEPWPSLAFTQGDLSSVNILARGDKVVAII